MLMSGIILYPPLAFLHWENFMQPSLGTVKRFIPVSLFVMIVVRNMKTVIKIWLILIEPVGMRTTRREEDALSELMELEKSLSTKIEGLKEDHDCCLFEEDAEDFPVLEADVLDNPTDDDSIEYFMTVEALHSTPDMPVVPSYDDYSDEEKQSPTSQFVDQRRNQPVYDNYESDSELDMQDFQEKTAEPYPLFIKEEYYEEINHPGPAEDVEQQIEEKIFPTGPVYDDYESDPWERKEEEEPEEQQKGQFIPCPEPVHEQPSPEISQPTPAFHPPGPTRDIQPHVNSRVAEEAACYKFSGFSTRPTSL
jgi:hypothetical protein